MVFLDQPSDERLFGVLGGVARERGDPNSVRVCAGRSVEQQRKGPHRFLARLRRFGINVKASTPAQGSYPHRLCSAGHDSQALANGKAARTSLLQVLWSRESQFAPLPRPDVM